MDGEEGEEGEQRATYTHKRVRRHMKRHTHREKKRETDMHHRDKEQTWTWTTLDYSKYSASRWLQSAVVLSRSRSRSRSAYVKFIHPKSLVLCTAPDWKSKKKDTKDLASVGVDGCEWVHTVHVWSEWVQMWSVDYAFFVSDVSTLQCAHAHSTQVGPTRCPPFLPSFALTLFLF